LSLQTLSDTRSEDSDGSQVRLQGRISVAARLQVEPGVNVSVAGEGKRKPTRARRSPAAATKAINLALQGGGAHGAFCWGVLDRLLEDERISFDGISATSAGSMNAAALAFGLIEDGRDGAKRALAAPTSPTRFQNAASPLQPTLWDRMQHDHSLLHSPMFLAFDLMSRVMSPYELNPLNINPLRRVLEETIDFEAIRRHCPVKLYLSATNVRTGKIRLFGKEEISVDAVLASACLPFLFHTVEIDGEAYWDGGYMGNPAIFPLIYHCDSADVVIVHINPIFRDEVPRTASEILSRVNELSFNSSLMREMRAIAFVSKLIDDGTIRPGAMKRMLIHAIADEPYMRSLQLTSKLNPDPQFLHHLHGIGRACADRWIDETFDALGNRTSIDLNGTYL
jgi:NTE family protein